MPPPRPAPPSSRSRRQVLLACGRPDGSDLRADPKLAAAMRDLGSDSSLRDGFGRQQEFDGQVAALIHGLPLPDDLRSRADARWKEAARRGRTWTRTLRDPALLAALLAILFLLGWAGWFFMERAKHFPGDENLSKMLDAALPATSTAAANLKLRPANGASCAGLGDALFLENGFDAYAAPPELAARRAVGYRVFQRPDGVAVSQVLLGGGEEGSPEEGLNFFTFRANDLGVVIEPPGRWRTFEGDRARWAAAAQVREDGVAVVIVSPGDVDALRRRLEGLGLKL